MADAQNSMERIQNNCLKDHQVSYIMSPDEIVGISAYMAEKVCPSVSTYS
jgi:hypothetical protein